MSPVSSDDRREVVPILPTLLGVLALMIHVAACSSLAAEDGTQAIGTTRTDNTNSDATTISRTQVAARTVTVTGHGTTVAEARTDALRLALQQAAPSFVSATRIVRNFEIVLDEILSASSGYIISWMQEELIQVPSGYALTATISVSDEEVRQAIALAISRSGTLDGDRLFQEQQQRRASTEAMALKSSERIAIFNKLFADFPHNAIDVRPVEVRLSPKDKTFLELDLLFSLKKSIWS